MYVNKDHVAEAIRLFKVSTGLASFGGGNGFETPQASKTQSIQIAENLIQRRVALGSDIVTSKLMLEFLEKGIDRESVESAVRVLKKRGILKEFNMGKILRRVK